MKIFITILISFITIGLSAQVDDLSITLESPTSSTTEDASNSTIEGNIDNDVVVYSGTIKEVSSELPLEFANVALYDKETDAFITGTTSVEDGYFEIQSTNRNVYLVVSFIGYETINITDYKLDGGTASFGAIVLSEEGTALDEIIVTAEKSTTEFRTDRRVFNVGTDLTNSGTSALELLNHVPSVNVDIEGSVTLRGSSGVQILINGKPSVLADEESGALGNITSDMIERIEVITNPSAKYEAEGTSGIINIILKKNDKENLNGSVTINAGTPHNHSIGLSLNKRAEKFNLFTQAGVGYKQREFDVINRTSNYSTGSDLSTVGTEARNEKYYNFVIGTDYYINPKNIITLSGSYTFEQEDQPSLTEFNLFEGNSLNSWTRSETTTAGNPKFQYDLHYKREFDDNEDHRLDFSAIGNYFSKDQSSSFTEQLINGTYDITDQLTATEFKESKYTYNLDYTKPLNEKITVETGVQYLDNKVSNDYEVQDFVDGAYIVNPGLTNLFEYDQKVLGAYLTGAYEYGDWGFKAGARVEHTDLSTYLANTQEDNKQTFVDLFPSVHISRRVNDRISVQASYSSRIYRPRLWNLNPFFNIRNNFSIRTGNPLLAPEYTDSYEVGSVFIYEKITFNVNAYQRLTRDKIEYISSFNEDNARVYSPLNIGTSDTKGLELNFKYTPIRKITFTGDMNYNTFTRKGSFNEENFDFSNDQWNTKLTTKFKVNKSMDLEATGRYNSEVQTIQGVQSGNLYMDFGARYKLLNGKIVANLSVRDVFSSRVRESFVFEDDIENYSFRQLGRFVSFGLSYGFGKGEAMTYGGGGRRR